MLNYLCGQVKDYSDQNNSDSSVYFSDSSPILEISRVVFF